jgi:acid phosphatase (class A)
MKLKDEFSVRTSRTIPVLALLAFALLRGAMAPAQQVPAAEHAKTSTATSAGHSYLKAGQLDGISLLPPPPKAGSGEERADLASARAVFHGRTPAEEERSFKDASLSMFLFGPAIGPFFKPGNLPKTEALFENVKKSASLAIDIPKDHFRRLRPYQMDPALSLKAPEKSFSYPSGHSARGTLYSLVFAELFPEKREAIQQIGMEIGWDRVLIGKHFPTDVFAGRVLGRAIMRELRTNPDFQRDFAEAKAEVEVIQRLTAGAR